MAIKFKNIWRIVFHLFLMVVAVALIIFGTFKWLHSYTNHGEHIEVPAVDGLVVEDAMIVLQNNSLAGEVTEYRYHKNMEEGTVIEQRPKQGAYVKEGRTIYLVVNSGKIPMKVVPDVADNSSLRAAETLLLGSGFKLTPHEYVDGDADWVYEIKYNGKAIESGTEIPEGSTLTIVAGNGNAVEDIEAADSVTIIESLFFNE
ncbi:MAG: PASTA domain-containing protein [Bacteroidaceae bacterium]|jgi:beta-lactam-binding protein with PASTA domain|nr:PASTA domain-containing protein [Bacteroidaceae bacterium]MBO5952248.1 PASTA domain-containing protein [Bacteroidaceae bacterium]MBR4303549.1 PASTA domain-containing protein [Bacteroidaceae bacterium]